MIMEQLKSDTSEAHQSLEKLLIPYIKQTKTVEAYGKLLQMFYRYMKPVEDAIDKHVDAGKIPMYDIRRKTGSILDDLNYWGYNTILAPIEDIPAITTYYQALGAMYVFEGSTLGGNVISKILKNNLNKQGPEGFSFYNGYGEHTHAMWGAFTKALNQEELNAEARRELVLAANNTFTKFENWAATTLKHTNAEKEL